MLFQKYQGMISVPEFGVSRKSSISSTIKNDSWKTVCAKSTLTS